MSPTYKPPPPEVVKQLEQSRRWLETSLKEGKEAYFADDHYEWLDLAGAVLSEGMLQNANLSHCRLDDADFYRATANAIRLEGASLARASFVKAELVAADFSGASGAWANFTKARLTRSRFDGSNFRGAQFFKADCWQGSFRDAHLEEVSFTRTLLDDANFTGALLDAADFAEASVKGTNFTGAFFTGATRLQGCRHLEHAIADRIFFDERPVEGAAAWEVLKSLTSPTLYDLLDPRECRLRLMLDAIKAARRSELTLRAASDSLSSLCSALDQADRNWREDVASHIATLGSGSLAAKDAYLDRLDAGRARIVMATLEALVRARSPRRVDREWE